LNGENVTHPADVIDNLIAATLLRHGRVREVDLVGVEGSERAVVLAAYFDRHRTVSPLHFEGGDLVSGEASAPAAPTNAGSLSDIDLLLEGYEGGGVVPDDQALRESWSSQAVSESVSTDGAVSADSRPAPLRPALDAVGVRGSRRGKAAAPDGSPRQSRAWLAWWAPVILLPLLGGIAAWFVLRHKHERVARVMLTIGIGIGMLGAVLFLRYAGDIAGFVSGASRGTVITLPAASTSTRPAGPLPQTPGGPTSTN
jgi:hypothetical protein